MGSLVVMKKVAPRLKTPMVSTNSSRVMVASHASQTSRGVKGVYSALTG